jgi:NAD-dependent DNA ligase
MKIQIPTTCPCCDYPLVRVNDQLFCKNSACSAQLNKKVEHFAKTLGIKGFGAKTIEKLQLGDLGEIFYLERDHVVAALGSEKIADKLLDEVERAKSAPLATVLASFSIPLIGGTASTKLSAVVSQIEDITPEKCKEAGLGEKATANLMDWLETEYRELAEFLPFSFDTNVVTPVATGDVICITGKLSSYKTKSEATTILISLGFRVSESVTKTTNYLVDEENKNSSKRKKAEEYGIPIISNLLDFINKVSKND